MPAVTPIRSVDLGPILTGDDDEAWNSVAQEFGKGLSDIGAAYLVNHGIDLELVEEVFARAKTLFQLPIDTKRAYDKKNAMGGEFSGFTEAGIEIFNNDLKLEIRESYDVMVTKPKFPKEVPEFEDTIKKTIAALENLQKKVFKLLALALNVDEQFFIDSCQYLKNRDIRSWTGMRVQKYPAVPEGTVIAEGTARCGEHTDWGFITFLFQDSVGGLEMRTRDGEWVHAKPVPGSIVVNAGEILEVWTKGYFPAVVHRVLLSEEEQRVRRDRYSFALFVFPDDDAMVSPLENSTILPNDYICKQIVSATDHVKEHVARSRGY